MDMGDTPELSELLGKKGFFIPTQNDTLPGELAALREAGLVSKGKFLRLFRKDASLDQLQENLVEVGFMQYEGVDGQSVLLSDIADVIGGKRVYAEGMQKQRVRMGSPRKKADTKTGELFGEGEMPFNLSGENVTDSGASGEGSQQGELFGSNETRSQAPTGLDKHNAQNRGVAGSPSRHKDQGGEKSGVLKEMRIVRKQYEGTPQWMKAPNGEPTKLSESQWLLVRTPSFKERFGDWEAATRQKFLDGTHVAEASTANVPTGGFSAIREWAVKIFEEQGGKAKNALLGEVLMGERSVRDSLAHGGANKYKKAAFAVVKDVIEKGILVHNSVNNGRDSYYFAAPVRIDGQDNIVVALVHRNEKNNTFYLHSVGTKKSLLSDRVSDQTSGEAERHRSNPAEGYLQSLQEVFAVNSDSISVELDKNGEPSLSSNAEGGQANQGSPDIVNEPLTVIRNPDVKPGSGISAPETIKLFSRVLEVLGASGAVRVGKMSGKKLLGHYELHSKVARIRTANDVSTAAHELAHALDDKLFGFGSWGINDGNRSSKEVQGEFRALGRQLYGDDIPTGGYVAEGFAEFVRLWLTDFDQAKRKAPNAASWWNGILSQNPKLAEAMATAQQAGHSWFRQGALERVHQSIVPLEKTPLERIAISRREASFQFRQKWIEAAAAFCDCPAKRVRVVAGNLSGLFVRDEFLAASLNVTDRESAQCASQNFAISLKSFPFTNRFPSSYSLCAAGSYSAARFPNDLIAL